MCRITHVETESHIESTLSNGVKLKTTFSLALDGKRQVKVTTQGLKKMLHGARFKTANDEARKKLKILLIMSETVCKNWEIMKLMRCLIWKWNPI